MAFTPSAAKQQNIAVNTARKLAFFEGSEACYNYMTRQWTSVPVYATVDFATAGSVKGYYSTNSKSLSIGLVVWGLKSL